MAINKRVFGSDIPLIIKQKLESRQLLASGSFKPGESVEMNWGNVIYDDIVTSYGGSHGNAWNHGEADLSSRTPFVRMWTALKVTRDTGDPNNPDDWIEVGKGDEVEIINLIGGKYHTKNDIPNPNYDPNAKNTYVKKGKINIKKKSSSKNSRITKVLSLLSGSPRYDKTQFDQSLIEAKELLKDIQGTHQNAIIVWVPTGIIRHNNIYHPEYGNKMSIHQREAYYREQQGMDPKFSNSPNVNNYDDYEGADFEDPTVWEEVTGYHAIKIPPTKEPLTSTRIYEVGNYLDGELGNFTPTFTSSLTTSEFGTLEDTDKTKYLTEEQFPLEHRIRDDENAFLKPSAGIVSCESITEGTLGVMKKTTVNFIVHNFADYDRIYNKYFLRPGAQIFVDFGWDTANLYSPKKLLADHEKNNNLVHKLYGAQGDIIYEYDQRHNKGEWHENFLVGIPLPIKLVESTQTLTHNGVVTDNKGDLETLVGIVTDYDSKINENGTVECSVTLTSKNSAMLTYPKLEFLTKKINYLVDYFALHEALHRIGDGPDEKGLRVPKKWEGNVYASRFVPNANSSAKDIKEYEMRVKQIAFKSFGSKNYNPSIPAILGGVFLPHNDIASKDRYLSLGWIEDRLVNMEFGFGMNLEVINNPNRQNFEVSLDSSNSYTTYNHKFWEKQVVMAYTNEEAPKFVIPHFWDVSYNQQQGKQPIDTVKAVGSMKMNKARNEFQEWHDKLEEDFKAVANSGVHNTTPTEYIQDLSYNGFQPMTNMDKSNGRIPIREIFIHTKVILDAFSSIEASGADLQGALQYICDTVNEDSYGVFKWTLTSDDDKSIAISDTNYINTKHKFLTQDDEFEKLFKFNVTSPKSIVTNYDLNFKMPEGSIGAMYAIQALSGGSSQVFPVNEDSITYANLIDLYQSIPSELIKLSKEVNGRTELPVLLKYLPDIGSFRAEQLSVSQQQIFTFRNMYNEFDEVFRSGRFGDDPNYGFFNPINPDDGVYSSDNKLELDDEDKKDLKKEIIEANNSKIQTLGYLVLDNFDDFFQAKIAGTYNVSKTVALPLELSLTTYGIGCILPGDIFRVDYLPKIYLESIYFQTIGIQHNVDSSGWYTTLETQFRYRKPQTSTKSILGNYKGYRLSPDILTEKLQINDEHRAVSADFSTNRKWKTASWSHFIYGHRAPTEVNSLKTAMAKRVLGDKTAIQADIRNSLVYHKCAIAHANNTDQMRKEIEENMGDGKLYSEYLPNSSWNPGGYTQDKLALQRYGQMSMTGGRCKWFEDVTSNPNPGTFYGDKIERDFATSADAMNVGHNHKQFIIPGYFSVLHKYHHLRAYITTGLSDMLTYMTDLRPLPVTRFKHIALLMKFRFTMNTEDLIGVINPYYVWKKKTINEVAYRKRHYGYGHWQCRGAKFGLYENNDEAYFIVNLAEPNRHWAVSPCLTDGTPGGLHTDDLFKKLYDIDTDDLGDQSQYYKQKKIKAGMKSPTSQR